MSAATSVLPCPEWCTDHSLDAADDESIVAHRTFVTVGAEEVEVYMNASYDPHGPGYGKAAVTLPEIMWVAGQDLRDLIAALTQAADLIEPSGHR